MVLNFTRASTQFVRNLVELGVCESTECLNAYHPPAGLHGGSAGTAQRQKSFYVTAVGAAAAAVPSTRPVIAFDVSRWIHALDSGDFPFTEVCHQLSSSELQLSLSLEAFIDELFAAVSHRYAVQLETLLRALCLLERVQMRNIRAHQQVLLSQPGIRSGSSPLNASFTSWQAPVLQPESEQKPSRPSSGSLLHAEKVPTPQLRPSSSASVPIAGAAAASSALSCSPAGCPILHHSPFVMRSCVPFDNNSVFSSGTVGPLTDTERLSSGECNGARESSFLTSWCLPPTSPSEMPVSSAAAAPAAVSAAPGAVDLSSLLSRLRLCGACTGSRVFTLQYYNVHLFLAACLALSVSINEMDVMDAVTEETLMHQIAEVSHCTDLPLQMAVRVVCETLGGELCVFDSEVDVLVHRLNIVETCVFTTEGI